MARLTVEPHIVDEGTQNQILQVKVTATDGENSVTIYLDYPDEYAEFDARWLEVDEPLYNAVRSVQDKEGN